MAAAIFELGGGLFGGLTVPLLLIGIGGAMLFRRGLGATSRKSKNDDVAFSGRKSKPRYVVSAEVNPDLQRKIDAALAEEEDERSERSTTNV